MRLWLCLALLGCGHGGSAPATSSPSSPTPICRYTRNDADVGLPDGTHGTKTPRDPECIESLRFHCVITSETTTEIAATCNGIPVLLRHDDQFDFRLCASDVSRGACDVAWSLTAWWGATPIVWPVDACVNNAECGAHERCLTAEEARPMCGASLQVTCPDGSRSDACGRCTQRCTAAHQCAAGMLCRDGTCSSPRSCQLVPAAMP